MGVDNGVCGLPLPDLHRLSVTLLAVWDVTVKIVAGLNTAATWPTAVRTTPFGLLCVQYDPASRMATDETATRPVRGAFFTVGFSLRWLDVLRAGANQHELPVSRHGPSYLRRVLSARRYPIGRTEQSVFVDRVLVLRRFALTTPLAQGIAAHSEILGSFSIPLIQRGHPRLGGVEAVQG